MTTSHTEAAAAVSSRRKRRAIRARLRSRPPLSARIVLDNHLRGDVALLSDDLVSGLFPSINLSEAGLNSNTGQDVLYVAVAPFTPHSYAVDDIPWTVIPARIQPTERSQVAPISHSTVLFPSSANYLQSFFETLGKLDPNRHAVQSQRPIEIRILDVVPLHLDAIYVTVERNLLRNLDDVQSKFGGGFNAQASNALWGKGGKAMEVKRYTKKAAAEAEERLTAAVREALSNQKVVHVGDILPLPLPSHPITHVPPPPVKISFCEPVAQGLLLPTTKVVLVQSRPRGARHHTPYTPTGRGLLNGVVEDQADDTSNEQFFSAAEDRPMESGTEMETTPPEDSETEISGTSDNDSSDDSLDDMISLSAPQLPQQPSGVMSAMSNMTPRPGGRRPDGIHTPGSVMSTFTSGTARPGRAGGKTFKAEGLLNRVPTDLLHPKPKEDDDTDAFVYVDINTLARVGCFSGDWVRIEATEEPQANPFASLAISSLNLNDEEPGNWRTVRIYGISSLPSPKPRYAVGQNSNRRSSVSQLPGQRLTPTVFVPPILLSNLDGPKYVKLSPLLPTSGHGSTRAGLHQAAKSASNKSPPVAKEVTLLKISTPLSSERSIQTALFAGLRRYFESKKRLVKSGDIVGISVDEGLGRAVFSATKGPESGGIEDDLTSQLGSLPESVSDGNAASRKIGVAWFRVGQVVAPPPEEQDEEDPWGGVAIIDSSNTRMAQAGSMISRIPGTLGNGWEYWLGVKTLPRTSSSVPTSHGLVTELPKFFVSPIQNRVKELMTAATSPRAIQLGMPPVVILLTSTQRHIGKSTLATRACADIGLHAFTIDAYDILTEGGANGSDVKTEAYLKARADRAFACGSNCTALVIKHIEVLTADRMITAMKEIVADSRVIIATTTDVEKIPEGIRSMFSHELEMTAPEEKEREGILRNAVIDRSIKISVDVDLAAVAVKTAALVAGDLVDVVERASIAKADRLEKLTQAANDRTPDTVVGIRDVQLAGGDAARCVTKVDFDVAVEAARKNFADSIGAPKIPNVTWDDVGGLSNVKDAVMETIQLPLERPELFAKGMKKRSGILFYGPPGTGKTLLAKAIATEFSLNFFSVKGPELLNMYIGESEANVRRVFQRARDARPCVVFFDELDSVAPKRGNQGDSGGVMDRIVSQLLAELDGMSGGEENGGGVFVIGATNRPDLLDSALLRPGRFDKMLYLGISDTHDKQAKILEALTRKFTLAPEVSLARVAERLPFTYTGADLYALCSDSMLKAITRQATAVDEKIKALPGGPVTTAYYFDHLASPDDISVMVTEQDFIEAQSELAASVSAKELEHFERIRQSFESSTTQEKDQPSSGPRTIGDAIDDLDPGAEIVVNGEAEGKAKSRPGTIGRAKGRAMPSVGGKGKGKSIPASGGGDSDSSFDGYQPSSRSGSVQSQGYDVGEEADVDGMEDGDGDDYVVKTDHLKVIFAISLIDIVAKKMGGHQADDDAQLAALGHKAELQRNFSMLSMLGLAFAILNSWTALSSSLSLSLPSGGSTSVVWGLITAGFCNLCIAASLAEFISAYPTAGGQYHWVAVGWKKWVPVLSFVTGWINCAGWVALVATAGLLASQLIIGIISLMHASYVPERWHQFLIYVGYNLAAFFVNAFMNSLLPIVTRAAFIWSIGGFVVISITVLACSSPNFNSGDFVFREFLNQTGWPDGIAWLLGLLQGGFGVTGYDAVAHMIEEIPNASIVGPKIMVYCVCIGTFTGAVFLVVLLFVPGNIDDVIESSAGPLLQILYNATNSNAGAICLLMIPLICLLFTATSIMTTSSRMIFAFGRDGGLPASPFFSQVHRKLGVPLNALYLTTVLVIIFGLIFLGSSSAFNAIISVSVVALDLSYGIPIFINVVRGRKMIADAPWKMPEPLAWFANIISLIYIILTTVLFLFPPELPVTGSNMNYCVAVFGVVVIVSVFQWFVDGRKNFTGPRINLDELAHGVTMGEAPLGQQVSTEAEGEAEKNAYISK
ncbi:Peroxisomal biogenesis factor 6 [Talaromyces islandicus]|uniref:Peroxisomal ATPase PEX6 n=1 Tax=Talaromyces islandicus TaxID=28573 RepID=A0A0U1LYV6_TALIS|nr:Peroxisomal biogenesis factor 6 [Talaromyces islandicus]